MKILYLITELDVGGAERVLYDTVTRLDRGRFEPVVVCLTGMGEVAGWLERKGVRVYSLGMRGKCDFRGYLRLMEILRREKPAVVHSHLFHANILGRVCARKTGVRLVVSTVHIMEVERPWQLRIDGVTSSMVGVETCVSEAVRLFTRKKAGVNPRKLVTIPNGIDVMAIDAIQPLDVRRELGVPRDTLLIVTVGRLHRQKGLEYLIDAAPEIVRSHPLVHFAVIGQGPLDRELRAMALRGGVGERVHFLGFRSDAIGIMKSCDVFVLPSLWEGMPIVILEAMASRLPVVATAVSGTPEVVEDGKTGLLVPAREAQALAAALKRLATNGEMRCRMGEAGRERVQKRFSADSMARSYQELYICAPKI